MKRSYKLANLGCANCAAKMEHDIAALDGVESARISFMTQRLIIEADESALPQVLEKARRICSSYESDCTIEPR